MGKKLRRSASRGAGPRRKRRRTGDAHQTKGLRPLSNVPLPKDQTSDVEDDQLSEQDYNFVEDQSNKLSFLEKIEKDEMDHQVMDKQKTEIEKRQAKIERAQQRAVDKRERVRQLDDDASQDGDDFDRLDRDYAKTQSSMPPPEVKGEEMGLPVKTPDGRVIFESTIDATAADLARKIEGVTVDDVFVSGPEVDREDDGLSSRSMLTMPKEEMDNDVTSDDTRAPDAEDGAVAFGREDLKLQIALLSNKMLIDAGRSVAPLKQLLHLCQNRDREIRRLAVVSCVRIFKDVIPDYKIETEATAAVVKKKADREQLKINEYESLLLRCYRSFLKFLLDAAEGYGRSRTIPDLRIAVRCLCGLTASLHRFNYGTELVRSVVRWMRTTDDVIVRSCGDCLTDIVRSDDEGQRSLEIVQLVGDLIKKQQCNCDPIVVECLFGVSFDDIPVRSKEEKRPKKTSKNKRKKLFKIREELDKQGKEFQIHPIARDRASEQKSELQSKTAEALFEIFFRVLKHCSHHVHSKSNYEHEEDVHRSIVETCPLLPVCLRGLAKHSHVMSVEYFEDLLQVMTKMLHCMALPFHHRLHCLLTICSIFKGQGDALTIDRREFYRQLYISIGTWLPDSLHSQSKGTDWTKTNQDETMIEVCHRMLCETKISDFGRLASFVKRLLSFGIHQETGLSMGICALIYKLLMKYRRLRALMEGESETPIKGSVYDPTTDDPDQAGGLLSCLWELTHLQKHFNPHTSQGAAQMLKIHPDATDVSEGFAIGLLTSSDGPPGVAARYSTIEGTFCPSPSPSRNQKRKRDAGLVTKNFSRLMETERIEEDVLSDEFRDHCRKLDGSSRRNRLLRERDALREMLERTQGRVCWSDMGLT